jgi:Cys-rich repeat protein
MQTVRSMVMSSFSVRPRSSLWSLSLVLLVAACGSDSKSDSGPSGTGGGSGAGGVVSTGGTSPSAGGTVTGAGGASPSGGALTGGAGTGTGGTAGTGGSMSSGGGAGVATDGGSGDDGGTPEDAGPPAPKGCRINADCATVQGKPLCDAKNNTCVACHTNSQCPATAECVQNSCKPLAMCKSSLDCASGAAGKTICDKANGACVECVASADCGDGKVCTNRVCHTACTSDNECMSLHMLCNKGLSFGGQCTECTASSECAAGKYCESGQCVPLSCTPAQQSCSGDVVVQCNDTGSDVIPQQQCPLALIVPACIVDGDNAKCVGYCEDKKLDALESDVDCGGPLCPRCDKGKACTAASDCTSNKCTSKKCE